MSNAGIPVVKGSFHLWKSVVIAAVMAIETFHHFLKEGKI